MSAPTVRIADYELNAFTDDVIRLSWREILLLIRGYRLRASGIVIQRGEDGR